MRVLIINKFLYPNGGSETYIFKLGEALEQHGHEVQYFGMEHEGRCVGNRVNAYTSGMDFHGGSKLSKLTYPIKTIYSKEARVQLRKVLDDFKPEVCHLNNFNYQLTPSIILEIVKWRKETGRLRGLHFQEGEYVQAKLVSCLHGSIFNVAVDLRPGENYGHAYGEILSFENQKQMYIPRGFAHGYLTLEDDTLMQWCVDNDFCAAAAKAVRYDSEFNW